MWHQLVSEAVEKIQIAMAHSVRIVVQQRRIREIEQAIEGLGSNEAKIILDYKMKLTPCHWRESSVLHYGKVLRLNDDGTAPDDNPFVESGEYLPEVYSVGHRNQLGMALHPETGQLWASENGPQGGDEANIILPGKNYGWPLASYSRNYRGDWVSQTPWREEFESPTVVWWPSIAPSALTFYTGEHFPKWQGNLFVGAMMEGRIPGTGHLQRIVFNSRGQEIRRESMLTELKHRVRDVRQGPDGYLYINTTGAEVDVYDMKTKALIRTITPNQQVKDFLDVMEIGRAHV
jgi:glucose/arabinose dehydrogenase